MSQRITIALDAMGGDRAPDMVIEGASFAQKKMPGELEFIFYGDEERISPILEKFPQLAEQASIVHTPEYVRNEDKPSMVLRRGRNTSMNLAIKAVSEGHADCVVSAGNTGALMVLSRLNLKTLEGIDRPAIAAAMPTTVGQTIVLDLGANVDASPDHLVQFALLGSLYARCVLGVKEPSIGLVNVGSEEQKGRDAIKKAAQILQDSHIPGHFFGFIEGDDIPKGTVDVAVTDGFTGNVLLKASEGVAKQMYQMLRGVIEHSTMAKIGYLFARPALRRFKKKMDPRRYNGAMFLGLKGVCVKSHGGTDSYGFYRAIKSASQMVREGFYDQVSKELKNTPTYATSENDRSVTETQSNGGMSS